MQYHKARLEIHLLFLRGLNQSATKLVVHARQVNAQCLKENLPKRFGPEHFDTIETWRAGAELVLCLACDQDLRANHIRNHENPNHVYRFKNDVHGKGTRDAYDEGITKLKDAYAAFIEACKPLDLSTSVDALRNQLAGAHELAVKVIADSVGMPTEVS